MQQPFVPPERFDDYRVVRPLGGGTMGMVFLGHDLRLDRPVAIKFIATADPSQRARERFLREARAIARLSHPNVVAVHRAGEVEGRPYLVSEYVAGRTLDDFPLPLPPERLLPIAQGLAAGLSAAHAAGVLHRDIKPANVIVTAAGVPKLLDFGLAKLTQELAPTTPPPGDEALRSTSPGTLGDAVDDAVDAAIDAAEAPQPDDSPVLTRPGMILGTPRYMAPELWEGAQASERSDLYALGALLYELAAGAPPHPDRSMAELRSSVSTRSPRPLRELAPKLPPRLCALIDGCLAREPARRPASVDSFQRELLLLAPAPGRRRLLLASALAASALCALAASAIRTTPRAAPPLPAAPAGPRVAPAGMIALPGGQYRRGTPIAEIQESYRNCRRLLGQDCRFYEREHPVMQVALSPFFLDEHEVTNADFAAWLSGRADLTLYHERLVYDGDTPLADLHPELGGVRVVSAAADGGAARFQPRPGWERRPTVLVSWHGAAAYCRDRGRRLPTESEWEYAARGAALRFYPWGDELPRCADVAHARDRGQPCEALGTTPAEVMTSKQDRTPEGVFDLGGNVLEWTQDQFRETYDLCDQEVCVDPVYDPRGPAASTGTADGGAGPLHIERVLRGGDLLEPADLMKGTRRSRRPASASVPNVGFRCAAS